MIITGIDVGFSGGICTLDVERNIVALYKMPVVKSDAGNELDYRALYSIINVSDFICVEKQHSMPKNGVKQSFNFGGQYYSIRAIIRISDKKSEYITPQRWKKYLLQSMDKSNKGSSIERAKQIYPYINLIPDGCRKEHDGLADAFLIAWYAKQYILGV